MEIPILENSHVDSPSIAKEGHNQHVPESRLHDNAKTRKTEEQVYSSANSQCGNWKIKVSSEKLTDQTASLWTVPNRRITTNMLTVHQGRAISLHQLNLSRMPSFLEAFLSILKMWNFHGNWLYTRYNKNVAHFGVRRLRKRLVCGYKDYILQYCMLSTRCI